MVTPSLSISTFTDGSLKWERLQVAPAVQLCRLKHDYERSPWPERDWVNTMIPQPFRAYPSQTIPMKNYPALYKVFGELNPTYTPEKLYLLWETGLCWCNPAWGVMEDSIITGGAVMEVEAVVAGRVYVRSFLISDPVPSAQYFLDNHLTTIATSVVKSDRTPRILNRANGQPDGARSNVRMFICRSKVDPIWFPAADVQLLPVGCDPANDPLWKPG